MGPRFSNPQLVRVEFGGIGGYSGRVELDFEQCLHAITGLNYVQEGADSNGTGKSSLCDAIGWVLTGDTPRRISADQVINDYCEKAWGTLDFVLDDGHTLRIDRSKKRGESQKLKVLFDGNPLPEQRVKELQAVINRELLCITDYADFLSIYYLTSTATKSFISLDVDPSDRYRILSQFLDLEVYDTCTQLAREEKNTAGANVEFLERRVSDLSPKLGEKSLEELGEELKQVVKTIDEIESVIASFKKSQEDSENKIKVLRVLLEARKGWKSNLGGVKTAENHLAELEKLANFEDVSGLEAEIKELRVSREEIEEDFERQIKSVEAMIGQKDSEIMPQQSELRILESAIEFIDGQLAKGLSCPACQAVLMYQEGTLVPLDKGQLVVDLRVSGEKRKSLEIIIDKLGQELRAIKGEQTQLISAKAVELQKIKSRVSALSDSIKKSREDVDKWDKAHTIAVDALAVAKSKEGRAKRSVADAEKRAEGIGFRCVGTPPFEFDVQGAIDGVPDPRRAIVEEEELQEDRIRLTADKVLLENSIQLTQVAKEELDGVGVELCAARQTLSHATFWTGGFPKLRDGVVSRFLPLFETESNKHLTDLGMTERVEFSLTRETQKGTKQRRFEIMVFDGKHWRSSKTYSSGEWGRIAISIAFAFRNVLTNKLQGGLNLLLCDEVADRLDATGLSMFLQLLKRRGGLSMVVSHRPQEEIGSFVDRIISITKAANETKVEILGP